MCLLAISPFRGDTYFWKVVVVLAFVVYSLKKRSIQESLLPEHQHS